MNNTIDIYRFIKSKVIREHLKKLDYQFTAPEAAYLVYTSKDTLLIEKIETWKKIIEIMPNCYIEERDNLKKIDDFHLFLQQYISLQDKKLHLFKRNDSGTYYYHESCFHRTPFFDYQTGLTDLKSSVFKDTRNIQLRKKWINGGQSAEMCINYNKNFEIKEVFCCSPYHFRENLNDYDLKLDSMLLTRQEYQIDKTFDYLFFAFPTPFKRGDILITPDGTDGPFVLDRMPTWGKYEMLVNGFNEMEAEQAEEDVKYFLSKGNYLDMWAEGYSINSEKVVEHRGYGRYLFCDKIREIPEGFEDTIEVLFAISEMIKGKLDIPLFTKIYKEYLLSQLSNLV